MPCYRSLDAMSQVSTDLRSCVSVLIAKSQLKTLCLGSSNRLRRRVVERSRCAVRTRFWRARRFDQDRGRSCGEDVGFDLDRTYLLKHGRNVPRGVGSISIATDDHQRVKPPRSDPPTRIPIRSSRGSWHPASIITGLVTTKDPFPIDAIQDLKRKQGESWGRMFHVSMFQSAQGERVRLLGMVRSAVWRIMNHVDQRLKFG
jgi:hypothetical protein